MKTDVTLDIRTISVHEPLVFIRAHIQHLRGGNETVSSYYRPEFKPADVSKSYFTPGRKPSNRVGRPRVIIQIIPVICDINRAVWRPNVKLYDKEDPNVKSEVTFDVMMESPAQSRGMASSNYVFLRAATYISGECGANLVLKRTYMFCSRAYGGTTSGNSLG